MPRTTKRYGASVRRVLLILVSLVLLTAATVAVSAEDDNGNTDEPWTFILPAPIGFVENDSFFGISDRHYTNGLYASATSGSWTDCKTCALISRMAMLPANGGQPSYHVGFFAGQSMFTPEVLSTPFPSRRDRPYAGWLYVGARLYRELEGRTLDRLEVNVGAVGPGSGADAVQTWWHHWNLFGGVPPLGWHAQIKDEPALVISEQRIWRVSLADNLDILPEVNGAAGNVLTYVGAGLTLRVGRQLGADWGPPRVQPAREGSDFVHFHSIDGVAGYVFAGFEERAVLRNIFLDGNSFQHSANIAKNPMVGDIDFGAELICRYARLTATYTIRTHEFKTQRDNDRFLSFSLSLNM